MRYRLGDVGGILECVVLMLFMSNMTLCIPSFRNIKFHHYY